MQQSGSGEKWNVTAANFHCVLICFHTVCFFYARDGIMHFHVVFLSQNDDDDDDNDGN